MHSLSQSSLFDSLLSVCCPWQTPVSVAEIPLLHAMALPSTRTHWSPPHRLANILRIHSETIWSPDSVAWFAVWASCVVYSPSTVAPPESVGRRSSTVDTFAWRLTWVLHRQNSIESIWSPTNRVSYQTPPAPDPAIGRARVRNCTAERQHWTENLRSDCCSPPALLLISSIWRLFWPRPNAFVPTQSVLCRYPSRSCAARSVHVRWPRSKHRNCNRYRRLAGRRKTPDAVWMPSNECPPWRSDCDNRNSDCSCRRCTSWDHFFVWWSSFGWMMAHSVAVRSIEGEAFSTESFWAVEMPVFLLVIDLWVHLKYHSL